MQLRAILFITIFFVFSCENNSQGVGVNNDTPAEQSQLLGSSQAGGDEIGVIDLYFNCLQNMHKQSSLTDGGCATLPHVDNEYIEVFKDTTSACGCSGAIYQHNGSELYICTQLQTSCGGFSGATTSSISSVLSTFNIADYTLIESSQQTSNTQLVSSFAESTSSSNFTLDDLQITNTNGNTRLKHKWKRKKGNTAIRKAYMYIKSANSTQRKKYTIWGKKITLTKGGGYYWNYTNDIKQAKPFHGTSIICHKKIQSKCWEYPVTEFIVPKVEYIANNTLQVTSTPEGSKIVIELPDGNVRKYDVTAGNNYRYDVAVIPNVRYGIWVETKQKANAKSISPKQYFTVPNTPQQPDSTVLTAALAYDSQKSRIGVSWNDDNVNNTANIYVSYNGESGPYERLTENDIHINDIANGDFFSFPVPNAIGGKLAHYKVSLVDPTITPGVVPADLADVQAILAPAYASMDAKYYPVTKDTPYDNQMFYMEEYNIRNTQTQNPVAGIDDVHVLYDQDDQAQYLVNNDEPVILLAEQYITPTTTQVPFRLSTTITMWDQNETPIMSQEVMGQEVIAYIWDHIDHTIDVDVLTPYIHNITFSLNTASQTMLKDEDINVYFNIKLQAESDNGAPVVYNNRIELFNDTLIKPNITMFLGHNLKLIGNIEYIYKKDYASPGLKLSYDEFVFEVLASTTSDYLNISGFDYSPIRADYKSDAENDNGAGTIASITWQGTNAGVIDYGLDELIYHYSIGDAREGGIHPMDSANTGLIQETENPMVDVTKKIIMVNATDEGNGQFTAPINLVIDEEKTIDISMLGMLYSNTVQHDYNFIASQPVFLHAWKMQDPQMVDVSNDNGNHTEIRVKNPGVNAKGNNIDRIELKITGENDPITFPERSIALYERGDMSSDDVFSFAFPDLPHYYGYLYGAGFVVDYTTVNGNVFHSKTIDIAKSSLQHEDWEVDITYDISGDNDQVAIYIPYAPHINAEYTLISNSPTQMDRGTQAVNAGQPNIFNTKIDKGMNYFVAVLKFNRDGVYYENRRDIVFYGYGDEITWQKEEVEIVDGDPVLSFAWAPSTDRHASAEYSVEIFKDINAPYHEKDFDPLDPDDISVPGSKKIIKKSEYTFDATTLTDGKYYLKLAEIIPTTEKIDNYLYSTRVTLQHENGKQYGKAKAIYDPDALRVTIITAQDNETQSVAVYRDNVHLQNSPDGLGQESIVYEDTDILPEQLYNYKISSINNDGETTNQIIPIYTWVPIDSINISIAAKEIGAVPGEILQRLEFSWDPVIAPLAQSTYALRIYHQSYSGTTTTIHHTTDSKFYMDLPEPGVYTADLTITRADVTANTIKSEAFVVGNHMQQMLAVDFNQKNWYIKVDWTSLLKENPTVDSAGFDLDSMQLERQYFSYRGLQTETLPFKGVTASIKMSYYDYDIDHTGMYQYRMTYVDAIDGVRKNFATSAPLMAYASLPVVTARHEAALERITLAISSSPGAKLYSIFRKEMGEQEYTLLDTISSKKIEYHDVNSIIDNKVYAYEVIAYFPNGEKLQSEVVYAKVGFPCGDYAASLVEKHIVPDVCTSPNADYYADMPLPVKSNNVDFVDTDYSFTNPDAPTFPASMLTYDVSTDERYTQDFFDWRTPAWRSFNHKESAVEYYASPFFSRTGALPFSGGQQAVIDHSLPDDLKRIVSIQGLANKTQEYLPNYGWELIRANLGYSTNFVDGKISFLGYDTRNAGIDSILLYNRFDGKLRVIVRHAGNFPGNKMKICLARRFTPISNALPAAIGTSASQVNNSTIFAFDRLHALNNSVDKEAKSCVITSVGDMSNFSYADFKIINYDMCTQYYPSQFEMYFTPYESTNIVLEGIGMGMAFDVDSSFVSGDIMATYRNANSLDEVAGFGTTYYRSLAVLKHQYANHSRQANIAIQENTTSFCPKQYCTRAHLQKLTEGFETALAGTSFFIRAHPARKDPPEGTMKDPFGTAFNLGMSAAMAIGAGAVNIAPLEPRDYSGMAELPEAMPTMSQTNMHFKGVGEVVHEQSKPIVFTVPGSKDQFVNSSNTDLSQASPTAYKNPLGVIGLLNDVNYDVLDVSIDSDNTFGLAGSTVTSKQIFIADFSIATYKRDMPFGHYTDLWTHPFLYPHIHERTELHTLKTGFKLGHTSPKIKINPYSGLAETLEPYVVIELSLKSNGYWTYKDFEKKAKELASANRDALPAHFLNNHERRYIHPDFPYNNENMVIPADFLCGSQEYCNSDDTQQLFYNFYSKPGLSYEMYPREYKRSDYCSWDPSAWSDYKCQIDMVQLDTTATYRYLPSLRENRFHVRAITDLGPNEDHIRVDVANRKRSVLNEPIVVPFKFSNYYFENTKTGNKILSFDRTTDALYIPQLLDTYNQTESLNGARIATDRSGDTHYVIGFRSEPIPVRELENITTNFQFAMENCVGNCFELKNLFDLVQVSYNFYFYQKPESKTKYYAGKHNYVYRDDKTGLDAYTPIVRFADSRFVKGYAIDAADADVAGYRMDAGYADPDSDLYLGLGSPADKSSDLLPYDLEDSSQVENFCMSPDYKGRF